MKVVICVKTKVLHKTTPSPKLPIPCIKLFFIYALYYTWCFKGTCSEIFGKWIFYKQADMVPFPTSTSTMVKKLQICISFVSNFNKKTILILFYKWWKPRFVISKRVFRWFLLNYTDFAHKISHIKPSKYDSTFGTKISICLKKMGGWGCGSEQAPLIII